MREASSIHAIFILLFLGFFFPANAQKPVNELTVQYQIIAQQIKGKDTIKLPVDGAGYTVLIKDNQTKTDFKHKFGSETVIYDNVKASGIILKNYGSQNYLYKMNQNDWLTHIAPFYNLDFKKSDEEVEYQKIKCKIATHHTDQGDSIVVYYTTSIIPTNDQYGLSIKSVKGLPVMIKKISGNNVYTYVLTSYSLEPIALSNFNVPKSGYRVMEYHDINKGN